ncbi:MAG TPA: DUF3592 domain-containing protein, partial [Candidatus Xenobia bacterium]
TAVDLRDVPPPRALRLRPDKRAGSQPLILVGSLCLGAVLLVLAAIFPLSHCIATTTPCRVTGHYAFLWMTAFDYEIGTGANKEYGWAVNIDPGTFPTLDKHPAKAVVSRSIFTNAVPITAELAKQGGDPGWFFLAAMAALGVPGVLCLIPAVQVGTRFNRQGRLLRWGNIVSGCITAHQPFNRGRQGRALFIQFEFKPDGYEDDIIGKQQVDRSGYRGLKNRQPVTVFYDPKQPSAAVVYECVDFEVAIEAAAVDAPDGTPLLDKMQKQYGLRGAQIIRQVNYGRMLCLVGLLTSPLWGMKGYGLAASPARTIAMPGRLIFFAPWFLIAEITFAVLVAAAQYVVWRYMKSKETPQFDAADILNAYTDYEPETIDDPLKNSLRKNIEYRKPVDF